MCRSVAIIYLITLAGFGTLYSQDQDLQKDWGTDIYLYLLTSFHSDDSYNEWSNLGGGLDIDWHLHKNWTFGMGSTIRYWNGRDEMILPLAIGPGYRFELGSSASMALQVRAGTNLTIGNDYAGFFAHLSGGLKLNVFEMGKIGLTTGIHVARTVVFHPSEFTYIDWIIGIRF